MKISTLLETTLVDLYRKMDGLKAMIADKATTPGEKENAGSLLKKIEDRLAREFPGHERPTQKTYTPQPYNTTSWGSEDWLRGMANAAKYQEKLDKLKKDDPEAYKNEMLRTLNNMKRKLKILRKSHVPGNVETADQIRSYTNRINSFIRREFPDMWEELNTKRNAANRKAWERTEKKRKQKYNQRKEAVKKEGGGTTNTIGKKYENVLKTLYNSMKGVKYKPFGFPAVIGTKNEKWDSGSKFLRLMPYMPMGEIRSRWNKFDEETRNELRRAIESVHTQGTKFGGFTAAQKKSLLGAMTPFKTKS